MLQYISSVLLFVYLWIWNFSWIIGIFVNRTCDTGWFSKAQKQLHNLMLYTSSFTQCCLPAEVLESMINRCDSYVKRCSTQKAAHWYRLLTAFAKEAQQLPPSNLYKNGTRHWTSTQKVMWVKYLYSATDQNFWTDPSVCFPVPQRILTPREHKINKKLETFDDNKWSST
jgi:hypothetical protein